MRLSVVDLFEQGRSPGLLRSGTNILRSTSVASFLLMGIAQQTFAQTPSAVPPFRPRIDELQKQIEQAAATLVDEPRLKGISTARRQALVQFVVGNMLFVITHELGHAIMGENEMPVLGREEDAADAFAVLTALKIGGEFTQRALVESAKGWYLNDLRDKKEGISLEYYGQHGLNLQRAYQIVCFMVGSDPKLFKDLADFAKIPPERQETCQKDYRVTSWSWDKMLEPHRRPADQPQQNMQVIYDEPKGELGIYARFFRSMRFLELVAEHAAERFIWPRPMTIEMRSCGESDASWSGKFRTLKVCYELAQEFAELYRDYGKSVKSGERKRKR